MWEKYPFFAQLALIFSGFSPGGGKSNVRGIKNWYCGVCGRTAGYPAAPAQIPACGFPAPGSSVTFASVRAK